MRFFIQPEPRPEQNMRTVSIDEIVNACENDPGAKPTLEHYFSPIKKGSFYKGIPAEKELGLFYRILQKTYKVEEADLNLHFSMEEYEGECSEKSKK